MTNVRAEIAMMPTATLDDLRLKVRFLGGMLAHIGGPELSDLGIEGLVVG